jgi:integrase
MGKLKQDQVHSLPPGKYADGDGLYLLVNNPTSRSWAYRYSLEGRGHWKGLGSASAVNLANARKLRDKMRLEVKVNGVDVVAEHKRERQEASSKAVLFRDVAESYISAQVSHWRGNGSAEQWRQSLSTYVLPKIGHKPVGEIMRSDILATLEPIWTAIPETARRIRNRIEAIFDFATARELRSEELANPAARRLIELGLPKQSKQNGNHHAAMPYEQVPRFMQLLRKRETMTALALEFTILNAARIGEVIGARWDEIDRVEAAWTIPGERMKAGRPHRVPLTKQALHVLDRAAKLNPQSELVFVNSVGGPLTPIAMWMSAKRAGLRETIHGFRSSFRDWAREETSFDGELAEVALAHQIKNKTEAAYARGQLFGKRRKLMEAWADYCGGKS